MLQGHFTKIIKQNTSISRSIFKALTLTYMYVTKRRGLVKHLRLQQGHREFPFENSREFPGISHVKNSRPGLSSWREFFGVLA